MKIGEPLTDLRQLVFASIVPATTYKNAKPAWHYKIAGVGFGGLSFRGSHFLDRRRHRDARALENAPRRALQIAPQPEMLGALDYFHISHTLQVTHDIGPFEFVPACFQPRLQFLPQDQRHKRTEHMPTNGFIALVVDRPGLQ